MSKGSPPPAPDPNVVAQAQTASNKETAVANADLNRISQNTPYGSLTYDINGYSPSGMPQYTQNVTLSPEQQSLYNKYTQGQNALADTAVGSLGNAQSALSKPFSYGGPGITTNIQNAGPEAIKQAQDAAYRGQTQYLDPQFSENQSALDAKLANQGLQVGNEAYDKAQGQFGREKQAAYQSARDASTLAGNQQQQALFGQGLSQANLQNQASQLGLQQQAYLYNKPLADYNALMTGSQPTNPTFGAVPGVNQANTDVAGIQNQGYQNQMAAYNAKNQGINNLFSLGGSVASAAVMSDRRLKRDIERVGQTSSGIPIYEFSYLWDLDEQRHIGVMADEVRKIIPEAVVKHPSGFDMVDYSMVQP